MDRVEPGTKVLVYSKSVGCSLEKVFNRTRSLRYPREVPFYGWIKRDTNNEQEYTITYRPNMAGGDFYLRRDFKVPGEDDLFTMEDFAL